MRDFAIALELRGLLGDIGIVTLTGDTLDTMIPYILSALSICGSVYGKVYDTRYGSLGNNVF